MKLLNSYKCLTYEVALLCGGKTSNFRSNTGEAYNLESKDSYFQLSNERIWNLLHIKP